MEFIKHECLCKKGYDEIDEWYILSINQVKKTLQVIENRNGSFGRLFGEFNINYCPMCR